MTYYKLPGDAVAQGYKQSPHCPCGLCREQVYHSPSKNFTGTEEEFYEEGHACLYIIDQKGNQSLHLSQKVIKALNAGAFRPSELRVLAKHK
ncbi:MAG TPA: hypothetical protein VN737_05330 [Bryobacteraceae bacterium]|nr:hypothetical protein [Bryobacteraceae bacterium]